MPYRSFLAGTSPSFRANRRCRNAKFPQRRRRLRDERRRSADEAEGRSGIMQHRLEMTAADSPPATVPGRSTRIARDGLMQLDASGSGMRAQLADERELIAAARAV